jgi:hypothetical protein
MFLRLVSDACSLQSAVSRTYRRINLLPLCRTFRGTHGDLLLLKCSTMSFEKMGYRLGNVVRIHVAHWFEGSSVF